MTTQLDRVGVQAAPASLPRIISVHGDLQSVYNDHRTFAIVEAKSKSMG
jgi:hypothetical protein